MDYMLEQPAFSTKTLDFLEDAYKFKSVKNCEIKYRWHMMCLKAGHTDEYPDVAKFVTSVGRMKYVRPIYRSFLKAKDGEEMAKKTFTANRKFYHPICANMVAKDLGL
jgi:leukotriene-A4 hydrolase